MTEVRTTGSAATTPVTPDTTTEPPATEPTTEPSTTEPPASPTTFKIGDPVALNLTSTNRLDGSTTDAALTVTVDSVRTSTVSADQYGEGPQNGLFVIASVHFQMTNGNLSYNPFDFELQLPDGTVYQYGDGNAIYAGINPTLSSGDLTTGQQVRGYIVFDANAPHGQILYKPSQDIFATWTYSVGTTDQSRLLHARRCGPGA